MVATNILQRKVHLAMHNIIGVKNKFAVLAGPTKKTVLHFWRMVWEYKVQVIAMLTKCVEMGKVSLCIHNTNKYNHFKSFQKKCLQYWPESLHETVTHGDMLNVTFSSSTSFAECEIRKFKVKSVSMKQYQLYFTLILPYTALGTGKEIAESDSVSLHCLARSWRARKCHVSHQFHSLCA